MLWAPLAARILNMAIWAYPSCGYWVVVVPAVLTGHESFTHTPLTLPSISKSSSFSPRGNGSLGGSYCSLIHARRIMLSPILRHARRAFSSWERLSLDSPTAPDALCRHLTPLDVLFWCCPPLPPERKTSLSQSLALMVMNSSRLDTTVPLPIDVIKHTWLE